MRKIHWEPLLAVVLWGGIYPGARLALREITVLDFTFLRLVVAAALLAAIWLPRGRRLAMLLFAPLALFDVTRHEWWTVSWEAWAGLLSAPSCGSSMSSRRDDGASEPVRDEER